MEILIRKIDLYEPVSGPLKLYGPLLARTFFVCLRVKIVKGHNWSIIINAPKNDFRVNCFLNYLAQ